MGGPAPDQTAARRDEAKAAFGRGNTAYNLGKYADAVAEFERAYALSKLPEILFNLGQCYRKQWEAEQRSELGRRALHYYEAVVREAPSAKVRPDAEQFITELTPAVTAAEARERQSKIAAAKGGEALQLAQTMFTNGQLTDAAGVLDRLLREADNGRELLAEGYLLRGRVAAGMGDPLAAEAQFKRALELRPSIEIPDPKTQETAALEAARKTAGGGLRLVQSPPGEATASQPAKIDVKVEGDTEKMVSALELGYRTADTGAYPDGPRGAAGDAGRPRADAVAGRARRLLRARAGRARGRAGRERLAHAAVPAAGRGPDRDAPRAAALVPEVVVLDGGRRGGRRRRRGHLHRDETQPQQRAGDLGDAGRGAMSMLRIRRANPWTGGDSGAGGRRRGLHGRRKGPA